MEPMEAVQAHIDLNAQVSIAGHFQVFQLGPDGFDDAVNELSAALKEQNLKSDVFVALEPGHLLEQTTDLARMRNTSSARASSVEQKAFR
jgi:hypothetical protein